MRVAIYARYSSDNQRESSITQQFRNCEEFANRQEGWKIIQRYKDEAISGATSEREGYQTMLRDGQKGQFDVLLVDALSRLSRDQVETEKARRRLIHWEVRLIAISDGVDTQQEGHEVLSSFKGIANEQYRAVLRKETTRGLKEAVHEGYHTGGRTYGYRHVRITDNSKKNSYGEPELLGVKRELDEEQARVVRQIFEWYDKGRSPRQIVAELNSLGIPSPGANYSRKCPSARYGTWAVSALHSMLRNQLYAGVQVWNRRKWVRDPDTEKKLPRLRPESEWIVSEYPELRIIDQDLWNRVQQRIKAQALGKWSSNKPRSPKYLLSSLLKCEVCGSNFVMRSYYQYGCGGNADRGPTVCSNNLRVSRTLAEEKILAGLQRDLFTQEGLDLFIKETTKLLTERRRERKPDPSKLLKIEKEIANIAKAIKAGILTPTTKSELEKAEAERARLQRASEDRLDNVLTVLPRAKERYHALIEGIGALSTKHLPQAREQIRTLVGDIWLKPSQEGHLEATLTGRYEGLVRLLNKGKTGLNLVGCGERI